MSGERGVSENELLMWIECAGDAVALDDIGRRLALDPELEKWARGARSDRDVVMALGRAEAVDAPSGLWREAVAEAERRALLLEDDVTPVRGPYRLRVTPMRLVAAAALLIVASVGSIAFIGSGPFAGPGVAGDPSAGAELAMPEPLVTVIPERQVVGASRSLAEGLSARDEKRREPRVLLASGGDGWAADANGIVAGRAMAGFGFHNMSVMEPTERELPGSYPQRWGMSVGESQRFASDGRLVVWVRARDVEAYVDGLLAAVGRRGRVIDAGLTEDANGISAPVELWVSVSPEKVERALRLCAIGSREMRLSGVPAVGRPGAWAREKLWWRGGGDGAGAGGAEPGLRVVVSSR